MHPVLEEVEADARAVARMARRSRVKSSRAMPNTRTCITSEWPYPPRQQTHQVVEGLVHEGSGTYVPTSSGHGGRAVSAGILGSEGDGISPLTSQ